MSSTKGRKIYKGEFWNNYELNDSNKAQVDGFIVPMLKRLESLVEESKELMERPRGIHFVLSEPVTNLKPLGKVLRAWARFRSTKHKTSYMSPFVRYLQCIEIRPRNGERHMHLYVIADSVMYDDLPSLKDKLAELCTGKVKLNLRSVKYCDPLIDATTGEWLINPETNEPIFQKKKWCHEIKLEQEDFFKRASYICKAYTKETLDSWSGSLISNIPSNTLSQARSLISSVALSASVKGSQKPRTEAVLATAKICV